MYQKTELDILFKALQARLDKNQIQLIAHWFLEKMGFLPQFHPELVCCPCDWNSNGQNGSLLSWRISITHCKLDDIHAHYIVWSKLFEQAVLAVGSAEADTKITEILRQLSCWFVHILPMTSSSLPTSWDWIWQLRRNNPVHVSEDGKQSVLAVAEEKADNDGEVIAWHLQLQHAKLEGVWLLIHCSEGQVVQLCSKPPILSIHSTNWGAWFLPPQILLIS